MAETSGHGINSELYKAIVTIVDDRLREIKATRQDFDELKWVVKELAEAQKKTEARLDSLAVRVEELAEAQKKTEARLDSLAVRVEELAEAQKKTEARLDSLAVRVEELAEAQKKTEEVLHGVIKEQRSMKKQMSGVTDAIGYNLENRAIVRLPRILQAEFGITVDFMDRRFIEYPDGREDEINIYGEGRLDGEKLCIVGESKSQLGRRDIDRFKKLIGRVRGYMDKKIIPILVTHSVRPQVERYAKKEIEDLRIYKSYQFED